MRYLLALAVVAACGSHTHETAPAGGAIDVGAKAPEAQVTSPSGTTVALAEGWKGHQHGVIVFYRGFY